CRPSSSCQIVGGGRATGSLFLPAKSIIRLESPLLAYLGRISYGLYVFHLLVIRGVWQLCLSYHIRLDTVGRALALLGVTLGLSVVVSGLSFRYFERPFLTLREKLTGRPRPLPTRARHSAR
ncbi:MAG: acyltransferase, partial [Cytophagaceae bacterium]